MDSPASPIRIAGFTRVPHIEAIAGIRDAIGSCGGFILDSHMYSNSMLAINFEIRRGGLAPCLTALERVGLSVNGDCRRELMAHTTSTDDPADVVAASLSVNFIHDDPPIRIEVPAVPG